MSVKCANCGYLAARHKQTRQLLDAEPLLRELGHIPSFVSAGLDAIYDPHPVCFRSVIDFYKEMGVTDNQDKRRDVIQADRECEEFIRWRPGFTPKEHWEMIQEADRLMWQVQREADDRAERDRRDQQARDFQASQAEQARRHQNRSLAVSAVAVGVAILGLIANTLIGGLKKPPTIIVQPTTASSQEETQPTPQNP